MVQLGSDFASTPLMARPLRLHVPGMLYHITSRGNDRHAIFARDDDYERFLDVLAAALDRFRVRCPGYCLMPNHLHLLLRPAGQPVSRLMQQVNSIYAQWFNRTHGHSGHMLQGRFNSRLVDSNMYYLRVLRYVVRNPVAAGLTPDPGGWRWSSYRATAGLAEPPAFLDVHEVWRTFDRRSTLLAKEQFLTFAASDTDDQGPFGAMLVGSHDFAKTVEPEFLPHRSVVDFVYAHRFAARPPLADILAGISTAAERDTAAREAFLTHAYTLREIGEVFSSPPSTVWRWVKRAHRQTTATATGAVENRDLTPEAPEACHLSKIEI